MVRVFRLVLSSVLTVGLVALSAPPASADGSTVYLDTTAAAASPYSVWSFGPGQGAAMKVNATSSATVTAAALLFATISGNPSPIATGSSVELWSEAGNGKMGELIGTLSYVSSTGQLAEYAGSVDVEAGTFWVKAINAGDVGAMLAFAQSPQETGTWQLVYGVVANAQTSGGDDSYFNNDSGRMLLSLASVSTARSVGAAPPPDQVQQVGIPRSGSCADVDDSLLAYGTNLTGGWTASWAGWANDGRGGAVCTRTLHYSDPSSGWTVQ